MLRVRYQGRNWSGAMMSKKVSSRPNVASKVASIEKPAKKIKRAMFKTDQWYAAAAMSIGIAGRAKSARPGMMMSRVEEAAE